MTKPTQAELRRRAIEILTPELNPDHVCTWPNEDWLPIVHGLGIEWAASLLEYEARRLAADPGQAEFAAAAAMCAVTIRRMAKEAT
jgi:hypothetical protein